MSVFDLNVDVYCIVHIYICWSICTSDRLALKLSTKHEQSLVGVIPNAVRAQSPPVLLWFTLLVLVCSLRHRSVCTVYILQTRIVAHVYLEQRNRSVADV